MQIMLLKQNYFIFMITDSKALKIIKANQQFLILADQNKQKYHYREIKLTNKQSIQQLTQYCQLSHPGIVKLYKIFDPLQNKSIKFSAQTSSTQQESQNKDILINASVGILSEYYCSTLADILRINRQSLTHEQIINTFEPIFQAIQFSILKGYIPQNFSLKNIVITEQQDVKFIDSVLLNNRIRIDRTTQNEEYMIFEQLASVLFEVLFPQQKTRSWKSRIRLAKCNLSQSHYTFFMSIYSKSLVNVHDPSKTKLIKKKTKNIKPKNLLKNHLYGKQNQLQQ